MSSKRTGREEKLIARWLENYGNRHMTLVLCGHLFGGRYGETLLRLCSFTVDRDIVILIFSEEERLEVLQPRGIEIIPHDDSDLRPPPASSGAELVIHQCSRFQFSWFSYGRKHLAENLCLIIGEKRAKSVTTYEEVLAWDRTRRPKRRTRHSQMVKLVAEPLGRT